MKKLIVIGGGFAGAYISKKLENYFNLTLIDNKDYFEFTPGILRTLVNIKYLKKIQVLHSHYLNKANIIVGCVKKIDVINKKIHLDKKIMDYDYLVIATGSRYSFPIKDEDIYEINRAIELREISKKIEKIKDILIVGGGIVGCELAMEIKYKYPDKNITIIHSRDRLMQRLPLKASKYAERLMRKNKIKLIFNDRLLFDKKEKECVINEKKCVFYTKNNKKIKTDMCFLCIGIKPNSNLIDKEYLENNFIKINEYLQLKSVKTYKNIFVCGDVNNIKEEKTAQAAEKQANIVIYNLKSIILNKKLKKYEIKKKPMVISLGKLNGIFVYKNFVMTGIIPAIMKELIRFKTMIRYK